MDQVCDFQSLDAWMVKVSDELEVQKWQGILGETKQPIYDKTTGEQIMTDRNHLLRGLNDTDYEVNEPFGSNFKARLDWNKMNWNIW